MTDVDRELYAAEVERHVLALREALVRHDENLKALQLLNAAPYFVFDRPAIAKAREDQYEMVRHIIEPPAYADYYASNPHERPFEDQYGIKPADAHKHIYRVQFLREVLDAWRKQHARIARDVRIIDLSANDGWMAVNLGQLGYTVDCVDLHPGNCKLAGQRKALGAGGIGTVIRSDLHDVLPYFQDRDDYHFDVVVCFETLEHVADPRDTLRVMRQLVADDGRIVVSTPHEAIERGNVPDWANVEPKGHVRAVRGEDLAEWLLEVGDVDRFEIGRDRVMVAAVIPGR